jgi:Fe-S cluster assembly iron-binding protein IscA
MITVSGPAARAIQTLCAAHGEPPSVRVRRVGSGRPLSVEVDADATHRAGDHFAATDGVVVRIDRELAAAVGDHTLTLWEDEADGAADAPRFVLTPVEG